MAIEHAHIRGVRKPWGSTDLRPWSEINHDGDPIGELWFQRSDKNAPDSALLFKLLFTTAPLSIQVHPDDTFAESIGLANGKSEVWYVLSATPDAKVAVGLKRRLNEQQLRTTIEDGSISDLVQWRRVVKDDVVSVPAGSIHTIGPGLVVAEIQQRNDTTFRLFDHGRKRELHIDNAVASANAGPAQDQPASKRLSDMRTLLAVSPHFILERIDILPDSSVKLRADHETWFFIFEGQARIGGLKAVVGDVVFLENHHTDIKAGSCGMRGLIAYTGSKPLPNLLSGFDPSATDVALNYAQASSNANFAYSTERNIGL